MDFTGKHSELTAQIAALRKQQIAARDREIYCGWTSETRAEYDKRADLLATLHKRLEQASRLPVEMRSPKLHHQAE
jgi:hypothetical protein